MIASEHPIIHPVSASFLRTDQTPAPSDMPWQRPRQSDFRREFSPSHFHASTEALLVEIAPQMGGNPETQRRSIWNLNAIRGPHLVILGEPFGIELDDELGIVLTHQTWSLMGHGDSLREAEAMLWECATDMAEIMKDDSPLEYTEDGNRLRRFVLQFLALRSS